MFELIFYITDLTFFFIIQKEEDKNVQYPNDPLEHSEPNRETSTQDAIASSETPSTPSDVSDIQIDPEHVEMDFNSDPDLPLDASSPHQTTANTSSNQGAKRYVLLQRPDNPNQTQDVHVWGPTFSGGSAPLRQVADHQSSQSSNDRKNPSSQVLIIVSLFFRICKEDILF